MSTTDGDLAAARVRRDEAGFPHEPEFRIETIHPQPGAYREPVTWERNGWECQGCGTLVLDPDRHIEFHDRIGDPL